MTEIEIKQLETPSSSPVLTDLGQHSTQEQNRGIETKDPNDQFIVTIKTTYYEDILEDDIKRYKQERNTWRTRGYQYEKLGKLISLLTILSSIIGTANPLWYTSAITAILATLSGGSLMITEWCFKQHTEVSEQINATYKSLGLDIRLPSIEFVNEATKKPYNAPATTS